MYFGRFLHISKFLAPGEAALKFVPHDEADVAQVEVQRPGCRHWNPVLGLMADVTSGAYTRVNHAEGHV